MIAILLVAILSSALGLLLFRRSAGRLPMGALAGVSFLVGAGTVSAALFVLSLLHIRWTSLSCLAGIAATAAILWLGGRFLPLAQQSPPMTERLSKCAWIPDLITTALVAGHGIFATLAPPPENDFLSLWGLKAKVFFVHGGIDWSYLTSRWNAFTLPDYPLFLPLLHDSVALIGRGWDDRWLGLLTTIFGAALILVIRSLLAERVGSFAAAIGTLALASVALIPWIGLAEAPLVAFAGSGIVMLRRGIRLDCRFSITVGAMLFGLAASTKNEGLTFAAAAVAGFLLHPATRRWFATLLPAILIPLPWVIVRSVLHLPSELLSGDLIQRATDRLRNPGPILEAIGSEHLVGLVLLSGIVLAVFTLRRELAGVDRPLFLIVVLQFLVCLSIYFLTAYDAPWQIKWSWERVMTQILVPFEILLVAVLVERVEPLITRIFGRAKITSLSA